jgi:hypothetical protein
MRSRNESPESRIINEIRARVTSEQHRRMKQRAYAEGLPLAVWIRMTCVRELNQTHRPRVRELLSRAQRRQLERN